MASPTKSNPLLIQAIDSADKSALQAVLKSMCESSVECSEQASQRLLVTRVHEIVNLEHQDENDSQDSGPARKKQKRETHVADSASRYETCATCLKRFDVTDNREDSCQLHDGDLEVQEDYFPHDDDIQAGEEIDVNSDERVDQFPEGFIWTCCEENAKGPPCIVQKHIVRTRP